MERYNSIRLYYHDFSWYVLLPFDKANHHSGDKSPNYRYIAIWIQQLNRMTPMFLIRGNPRFRQWRWTEELCRIKLKSVKFCKLLSNLDFWVMSPRLSGSAENSTALKVGFNAYNKISDAIQPRNTRGIHFFSSTLRTPPAISLLDL